MSEPGPTWIIQAFSGDSIKSSSTRIASDIVPTHLKHHRTVLVCSACVELDSDSSYHLLHALRSASKVKIQRANAKGYMQLGHECDNAISAPADLFLLEYSDIARRLRLDTILYASLQREIDSNCAWLRWFILTFGSSEKWTTKLQDVILALSEKLSSLILSYALLNKGFHTEIILAEDIEASINGDMENDIPVIDLFTAALTERVKQSHPRIPIVTGRLSYDSLSQPREGGFAEPLSILLSIGLAASEFQLWTAGNGILTADLRQVPNARVVPTISQKEAAELSRHGRPSVSPRLLRKLAMRKVPIKIASTEHDTSHTTMVEPPPHSPLSTPTGQGPGPRTALPTIKPLRFTRSMPELLDRRPTAAMIKERVFTISVTAHPRPQSQWAPPEGPLYFTKNILGVLERHGTQPEIMNCTQGYMCLAFEEDKFHGEIGSLSDELDMFGIVFIQYGLSILTLVGERMRHGSSLSGQVSSILTQGGVKVVLIGPGTGMSVSCVLAARDAKRALQLVHQTLFRKLERQKARN